MPSNRSGKRRRRSRRLAVQALYAGLYLDEAPDQILKNLSAIEVPGAARPAEFCRQLIVGVRGQGPELDEAIKSVLEHWRLERLSRIDHLILQLALYELRHYPDIPAPVTINEFVEVAKEFGGEESAAFVNGVLDRLAASSKPPSSPTGQDTP